MKTKTILLAVLSVLLPAAACADDPKCNCDAKNIDASPAAHGDDGKLWVYGKLCEDFAFDAWPILTCTGFNQDWVRTDCKTNVVVHHDPGCKPIESVTVSFKVDCDHTPAKRVPVEGAVSIYYGDGLPPGVSKGKGESMHWRVGLGQTKAGREAGRLRIDAETFSPALASIAALRLDGPGVVEVVPKSPIRPDLIRQVRSDECVVDVREDVGNGYALDFYRPSDIAGANGVYYYHFRNPSHWVRLERPLATVDPEIFDAAVTNAVYVFRPDAVPFVTHLVQLVGETAVRITETWAGAEPSYREFSANGRTWTLDENGARSTTIREVPTETGCVKTWTVSDNAGSTNVTRKTFLVFDERELPVLIETGVGDDARVTRQTYCTNASDAARFGKLLRREESDGAWSENEYDGFGRISVVRSGWLSGGTNDSCRRVAYSYAPLFPATNAPSGLPVDDGVCDTTTPRVETVYVGDSSVEKILRAIHKDTMGYIRVETVRLLDPTVTDNIAAWTDPANPHSLAIYMPENYGMPCSKLPWLVVNPDGTATSYDYISGDYVPGADGTPGVFTQVRGGPYFRTIATHGTAESFGIDSMGCSTNYAGIPLRTTRDVKLELRTGKREVLRMTEVCNTAGGYETVSWTTTTLDDLGHVVATRSSDGSRTENEWLGDRLVASTGADGIRTTYAYDGLGRRISSTYTDPLTGAEVVSSTTYDAAGRVLASTTTAGGLSQSTQRRYDGAGRLVWSCGPDGIENTTSYGTTNGLHFVATTRGADGLLTTSATYSYADGRTAYVERNGKRTQTYDYGYAEGLQWTIAYEGPKGTDSPVWTASVSDAFGRTISELRPGFGGSILETSYTYNAAGQLLSSEEYTLSAETTPRTPRTPREILSQSMASQGSLRSLRSLRENQTLRSRTLNLYDSLGALRVSASDVNLNGTIDFAGPDIVSSNETAFAFLDSAWWREFSRYSFPDTDSAAPLRVSTTRTRLSGLGVSETTELGAALLASETRSIDALGNVLAQKSYRNRAAHTAFNFSTSAASALSAWSFSIGGHSVSNRTATGILSSRAYDALGRVVSTTDGRGNVTSYSYDERGRLASTTDATGATTAYGYDSLGRQTSVTNALGLVTTTSYDLDNNITAQGGAQYPVWYSYDDYGRMRDMTTFRTEDLASGDVTTWHYDEATGLLVFKEYADGKGPTYDYTPEGKLSRRTWARGVTTEYSFDSLGNLIDVIYSDSTPNVSFRRDRLGNILAAFCSNVSTNLYSYNRLGQVTNEVQNGTTISRVRDTLGRETGYAIGCGAAEVSLVSYSYDALGRFASVVSGTNTFSYTYLPGSDLVSGMTANSGHAWERIFEPDRDLIESVYNHCGDRTISRFDYTNDAIGRRIARVDSGEAFSETAFERYSYNNRSEVIGSQRFYGSDIDDLSRPVTGRTFGYGYDPIGNRISSFEDVGGRRLTTSYTANEDNQFTTIQNARAIPLRGDVARNAVVTVNGATTERDSGTADFAPWSFALGTGARTAAGVAEADILAVMVNTNGNDVVQSVAGSVFATADETHLEYDDDGNLVFDGRFAYDWDAENRLIAIRESFSSLTNSLILCRYDFLSRNILIETSFAPHERPSSRVRLFNGMELIGETCCEGDSVQTDRFIWGLDLSGLFPGIGGAGGLLYVESGNSSYCPMFDANGNAVEYVDAFGSVSAHFEYGPFGELIQERNMREPCHFRFRHATQYFEPSINLYFYAFRCYSPSLARWLSRDPVQEYSCANLYSFSGNRVLDSIDRLGLFQFPSPLDKAAESAKQALSTGYDLGVRAAEKGIAAAKTGLNIAKDKYAEAKKAISTAIDGLDEYSQKYLAASPELLEFAILASLDIDIELTPELISLVRADPAMIAYEQRLIDAMVVPDIVATGVALPAGDSKIHGLGGESTETLTFGGDRAPGNMIDQLKHPFAPENSATWAVAANPLTWMLRHAKVDSKWAGLSLLFCNHYLAYVIFKHDVTDTLDLRPHKSGNHSIKAVINAKENPYDAVTVILGTLYHDIGGHRDDLKVHGEWFSCHLISGEY